MLGFQPDDEQQLIRDTVAEFAREQLRPIAHEADESGICPASVAQQAWELGLVQSTIPEAYGGVGAESSAITGSLICEELAWGDLSLALHILSPQLVTYPVIMALGTHEQKVQVLSDYIGPHFTAGTAAVMEPRFGFDLNELTTTAAQHNGEFVLNGTKCFVPLAAEAAHLLVYTGGDSGIDRLSSPSGYAGTDHRRTREEYGPQSGGHV